MATRAAVAGTAAVVTTWAAIATIATAVCSTTAGFAAGAEVAELAGELCVERIVEADGNRTVAGGHGITRTSRTNRSCRCRRSGATVTVGERVP